MDPIEQNAPRSPLRRLEREETTAELLGISKRHLRTLRAQRLIPYIKLGRVVRFDPEQVARAVARLTVVERV